MKLTIKSTLMVFIYIGLMGFAHAEDTKTEDHSAHHPEGQTTETKTDETSKMGMMEKMDMHAMMGECMKMHKDGKMCDHEMMNKCQKQMPKGDCMKMMKEAKVENSKKTKK